jgi:hypothetical protein
MGVEQRVNKELIEKIIAYNYNEYGSEFGDALVDLKHENEWLHHIIKEVREEIRILETNCDIVDYQAQKLYQILDKGE